MSMILTGGFGKMSYNELMRKIIWFCLSVVFFGVIFVLPAQAAILGQNQYFFLDKQYDWRSRSGANATLRSVSGRAYGYVEDSFWDGLNRNSQSVVLDHVNEILKEFDNRIYPIETQTFGFEPNPGIDKDSLITILFTPLVDNAGGYFNTADCYARTSDNMTSNQREMFYLNSSLIVNEAKMEAFLAHEFQHLISFNQKELLRNISDDTWLNEVRSEYAVSLLGYNTPYSGSNLEKRAQSFLANPSDSLTEWKNQAPDYGQIAIFGEYLIEHWPVAIFSDALKSDFAGIPSLNYALAKNGGDTFYDIFKNWMIADILNDTVLDPKFGYAKPELKNLKVTPTKTITNLDDESVFAVSDSIKDWQQHWYEISGFPSGQNPVLKIKFISSSLTSFEVPYLVFKADGTIQNLLFKPNFTDDTLYVNGIGSNFSKIIFMPFKKDKISGFGANENAITFSFTVERVEEMPTAVPAEIILPVAKPVDFGLHEGDFIRAEGDIDVYIINDFGYKRLILNPAICLMYGHLGARGCFSAVKTVSPAIRDAFKTSWYLTNGETKDGRVYKLEQTGDDAAALHWLNLPGADFISQGGDFDSVFLINSNEQRSYLVGSAATQI